MTRRPSPVRRWSGPIPVVAVLLLVTAVAGCGGTRADPMARGGGERDMITLRVNNLNFNDATLTLMTSGTRNRIGIVPGKSTQTFTVPWPNLQELRVQISVLAGGNFTTSPVTVGPGERVELLIQENVRASQLRR
jgi:hypothetical protein